jgi:type VI protein secretion system component VasK
MVLAQDDLGFWNVFWLLVIFIPLLLVWSFAVVDIFRRDDLNGWLKAVWLIVIILVPFLGTLVYLIFRPQGATALERQAMDAESRDFVARYAPDSRTQQLQVVAELHDRGKLTDAEYESEKARIRSAGAVSG